MLELRGYGQAHLTLNVFFSTTTICWDIHHSMWPTHLPVLSFPLQVGWVEPNGRPVSGLGNPQCCSTAVGHLLDSPKLFLLWGFPSFWGSTSEIRLWFLFWNLTNLAGVLPSVMLLCCSPVQAEPRSWCGLLFFEIHQNNFPHIYYFPWKLPSLAAWEALDLPQLYSLT